MSKDIQIQAFQFLGGNRSELDKRSERPASREWQEIVGKFASTVPNVFPTCPGPREIEQAKSLSFINVPMGEPGMRSHTVYFAVEAAGGRSFFNVLCFAYHGESISLRELAALSPSDWWSICERLTASDTKLTLPEKDMELELPEWDGKKALFFRVPGFGGSVIQGEFEDWRETLKQASPPPYLPALSHEPKHFPLKEFFPILRRYWLPVLLVVIMSMVAIYALPHLKSKPEPTSETKPVPTAEQPAHSPASEPDPSPELLFEPTDSQTKPAEYKTDLNTEESDNNE